MSGYLGGWCWACWLLVAFVLVLLFAVCVGVAALCGVWCGCVALGLLLVVRWVVLVCVGSWNWV